MYGEVEIGYLKMRTIIIVCYIILMPMTVLAARPMNIISPYNVAAYDAMIEKLYVHQPIDGRLEYFSAFFLEQRYLRGALGEGVTGEFDQSPLYRTDAFDCFTYVSTVLALLNAHNLQTFQQVLKKINYLNGQVLYQNRNHFMSVDWNPNNQRQGFIKDITTTIHNENNQSVAQLDNVYINKKTWYDEKDLSSIKLLSPLSTEKQQQLLERLRSLSAEVSNQEANLHYVPLTVLFDKQGRPNQFLFDQIPSGSIIEIVPFNLKIDGTDLDVSHLGFALRTQEGLIFREASLIKKKVIDIPLAHYLRGYLNPQTVKGINIQLVL